MDSWEKFEDAAQQATQGAARKAMDYPTDTMDLLRTDVEEQMERRTKALLAAQDSEEFRQPGQVKNMMGQARYLWERNEEFKKKIASLETQRQELEGQRVQAADERLQLRDQIKELNEERERLWQQLEDARAPPPPMAPDSQETASKNSEHAEAQAGQLQRECEQLSGEREALWKQVLQLQAINTELSRNLEQANLAIDICLPCVKAPPGAPVTLDESMLALVTSVGKRPMRYPQLSAPLPLAIPRGPLPSVLDTPTSQLTPILSTPIGRPPLEPPLQSITTLPRLTPQTSASLAAPPHQEPDREEDMDSEPQQGPESQQ